MKTNWDLTHLYINEDLWKKDVNKLKTNIKTFDKIIDNYQYSKNSLKKLLNKLMEINKLLEKTYCYQKRKIDLNLNDKDSSKKLDKVLELNSLVLVITNKFKDIVLNNSVIILNDISDYAIYKRYLLAILKDKEHLLELKGADEYSILEKENIKFSNEYRRVMQNEIIYNEIIDDEGKKIIVNDKNYNILLKNNNETIRKDAFLTMQKSYKEINKRIYNILNNYYDNLIKISRLKKYKSVLEMQMKEDELSPDIYMNLLDTISNNFEVIDNYNRLKKTMLKTDKLYSYDSNLFLTNFKTKKYKFEDAINIIKKSLVPLGNEYINKIDKAFDNGWIDVYESEFKRKDSFSTISYFIPYSLINYKNDFVSIKTLIHELGHAIHTDYARENNEFVNFEYPSLLAEITSKVNEFLLYDFFIKNNNDKNEKIDILNSIINSLFVSFFYQSQLSKFEHEFISLKENDMKIDIDVMNEIYFNLIKEYNGNEVITLKEMKYSWVRIPHFIVYHPYYVYQYSLDFCLAVKISKDIIDNKNNMRDKYLEFLKLGNSVSIIEALSILNIDLNDSIYIEEAINYCNSLISELTSLLDR